MHLKTVAIPERRSVYIWSIVTLHLLYESSSRYLYVDDEGMDTIRLRFMFWKALIKNKETKQTAYLNIFPRVGMIKK